ncbi:MAG: phosphatidylserine decarboxylase [Gammaproteobacteria bacterium]
MSSNTYPLIAKEGWSVLATLIIGIILSYFYLGITLTTITVIILCFIIFILRDPVRIVPSSPLALVSPVHGKIVSIKAVDDPWVSRKAMRIRIRMSVFDIYSLRSPIEGKIMEHWPLRPTEEFVDRKFVFWVKTDEDDDVATVIHLNIWTAINFSFYSHSGERIGQGQRCGFLKFGGLIDVFVPENCKINIEPGQYVNSGSDILAYLVHTDGASAIHNDDKQDDDKLVDPAY